ncbi:MAG: microcin C transport system ATP-binding protein [Cellvibrionaceae bacterium]|jgi:microcin C transport system ATP-binding protein
MTKLLSVNDLSISFHQGEGQVADIVKGISFDLEEGETLALVGESGSGKSLTAHAIMGLLPYPMAFHPSGVIQFGNRDLLKLSKEEKRAFRGDEIGMIFQEPISALNPLHTIEKQIREVLSIHQKDSRKAAREKILELLQKVKIKDPEAKLGAYPHQLSGGQRQRVMIAMALANKPKLLIADEPTTALDLSIQKEIMDLLIDLKSSMDMSILLITHDLGVVRYIADRTLVMQAGRIVEENETHLLFKQPQHPYTKLLINSRPTGSPIKLDLSATGPGNILSVRNLEVKYPINKPLFRKPTKFFEAVKSINLDVPVGSTLGIVGESGSGKSTLALAILRLIASSGTILLNDKPIDKLSERALKPLRKEMQIIFQDPFASLSPRLSLQEIISEGLCLHEPNLKKSQIEKRVIDIMLEVGLDPQSRHRYPHEFSGGQRQRIAIARALILNPKLVFLDEPTSALDYTVQARIIDLLRHLQEQRQLTYILISHDVNIISVLSHRIVVLSEGRIIEQNVADEVLKNPQHSYTQKLLAAALN